MNQRNLRTSIAAAVIVHNNHVLLIRRKLKEGTLSWQFPAGEVEIGETPGQAAVRETAEEVGLSVTESNVLGERIHPVTGRTIVYIACDYLAGDATVIDTSEIAELTWSPRTNLAEYVPLGFYAPVQNYLDEKVQ